MIWSDWNVRSSALDLAGACLNEHEQLRVTVWPLTSTVVKPLQIALPKLSPSAGYAFSPDQRHLAFISRHPTTSRDHLGIYDALSWKCVRQFTVASTPTGATPDDLADVTDVSWSPCGRYLALVDASVFGLRVEFRTPTGVRLGRFPRTRTAPTEAPRSRPAGVRLQSSSQQQPASAEGNAGLGVRTLAWRPQGDYLAIGGWDGKVRIVNDLSWTSVCELDLHEKRAASSVSSSSSLGEVNDLMRPNRPRTTNLATGWNGREDVVS